MHAVPATVFAVQLARAIDHAPIAPVCAQAGAPPQGELIGAVGL
jgi:hypothetical protein